MKRLFCVFFAAVIICLSVSAVSAAEVKVTDFGYEGSVDCTAIYLEELNTGTVVYEYYADESYHSKIYPASTTKVMTYIVVAENVPDPDNTMIEITYDSLEDLDPESSVMGLEYHVGQSFSVRDLLYGLMLPSGNDAALVLARYVGNGSVSAFVDLMNRKAAQLGCKDTHFTSPHGLHDAQHYTTLRDMATITKYAMKNSEFREICGTVSYTPEGFSEAIKTTNYLLDSTAEGGAYYYPAAKGIKTGYTDEAGKCLISVAEKDGYRYLCLAMGADYSYAENINYAMLNTIDLYDWAFDSLTITSPYDTSVVVKSLPVRYVWGNKTIDLVPESSVSALLPKDYDPSNISYTPTWTFTDDIADAPVKKGDVFGTMTVTYTITERDPSDPNVILNQQTLMIGKAKIVAAEDVDRDEFNYFLHRVVNFVRRNVVLFIVLLLVMIIIIILIIRSVKRKKARERRRSRARIRRED